MGTTRPNCKTMEKIKRDEIEIMAPVGCYESLAAAVQAGADSRPPARTASALT